MGLFSQLETGGLSYCEDTKCISFWDENNPHGKQYSLSTLNYFLGNCHILCADNFSSFFWTMSFLAENIMSEKTIIIIKSFLFLNAIFCLTQAKCKTSIMKNDYENFLDDTSIYYTNKSNNLSDKLYQQYCSISQFSGNPAYFPNTAAHLL